MGDIKKVIARVRATRFAGYSQDILDARQLADRITELEREIVMERMTDERLAEISERHSVDHTDELLQALKADRSRLKAVEQERDLMICEYLRRVWWTESPFKYNDVKRLVYGMFPDKSAYLKWKAAIKGDTDG